MSYRARRERQGLAMLREEKPIYLYEFGTTNAGPMTGDESSGEDEGLGG
jgi:hypothetical protein